MQFAWKDRSLPIDPLGFLERNVHAGIYVLDTATDQMTWSEGIYEILDLTVGEVTPSRAAIREMIHPEDRKPISEMDFVFSSGRSFHFEHRLITRDRRVRWISNNGEFLLDESSKPTILMGMLRDVSVIHDADDSLNETRQLLSAFLDPQNGVIWTASANGDVTRVANWQNKYLTDNEPLGWKYIDLLHPDDRASAFSMRQADIAKGSTYTRDLRILHVDGNYHWYRCTSVPIKESDGSIRQWIGFNTDISAEKSGTTLCKSNAVVTGAQLRAARCMLRLSVRDLFKISGIPIGTIRRLEEIDGPSLSDSSATSVLRQVLEKRGALFLFPEGLKPAVSPA